MEVTCETHVSLVEKDDYEGVEKVMWNTKRNQVAQSNMRFMGGDMLDRKRCGHKARTELVSVL